jgi:hypothetical protein
MKAYQSGGYTMKQIGEYFKVHYSLVSCIVSVSKTLKQRRLGIKNERAEP